MDMAPVCSTRAGLERLQSQPESRCSVRLPQPQAAARSWASRITRALQRPWLCRARGAAPWRRCYERALDLDPRSADAWVARGAAFANQRQFARAAEDFEMALGVAAGLPAASGGRRNPMPTIARPHERYAHSCRAWTYALLGVTRHRLCIGRMRCPALTRGALRPCRGGPRRRQRSKVPGSHARANAGARHRAAAAPAARRRRRAAGAVARARVPRRRSRGRLRVPRLLRRARHRQRRRRRPARQLSVQ